MTHTKDDCLVCMKLLIRPIELERLRKYFKNKPQEQEKRGLDEFFWD